MFATLMHFVQKINDVVGTDINPAQFVNTWHSYLAPHISKDLAEADNALQVYIRQNSGNPEKTTPSALFAAGVEWARAQAYAVAEAANAQPSTDPVDKAIELAQDVVDVANKAVSGDTAGAVETALSDASKLLTPEQVATAKPPVDVAKAPANAGTSATTVPAPVSADAAITTTKGK